MTTPSNRHGLLVCVALVVVFFLLSSCAGPVSPHPEGPAIVGVVMFDDAPFSGVTVEVEDDWLDPTISRFDVTDSGGEYAVELEPFILAGLAEVHVWFRAPTGYNTIGRSSAVSSSTDTTLDHTLTRTMSVTYPSAYATGISLTPTVTWLTTPESATYMLVLYVQTGANTYTSWNTVYGLSTNSYAIPSGMLSHGTTYAVDVTAYNTNGTEVGGSHFTVFTTG